MYLRGLLKSKENWTIANLMYSTIFANGKRIASVFGRIEKLHPRSYVGWFLATFSLVKYDFVVRYNGVHGLHGAHGAHG